MVLCIRLTTRRTCSKRLYSPESISGIMRCRTARLGRWSIVCALYASLDRQCLSPVLAGGHAWLFIGFERLFGLPEDPNWSGYLGAQCIFLLLCLMVTTVRYCCVCYHMYPTVLIGRTPHLSTSKPYTTHRLYLLPLHITSKERLGQWPVQ